MNLFAVTNSKVIGVALFLLGWTAVYLLIRFGRRLKGNTRSGLQLFVFGLFLNIASLLWALALGHQATIEGASFDIQNVLIVISMGIFTASAFCFAKGNEELLELDERKTEFISSMAHQIRTPLMGIKWMLDILMLGETGPLAEEQQEVLKQSHDSSERMIASIDEILQADRIASERYDLQRSDVSLADIAEKVVVNMMPFASVKKVTISYNRGTDLPSTLLDKHKVQAALQILLDNAVIYSKKGGTISVTLTHTPSLVECTISDHGIGIPNDQRSQICSRFFRASNATEARPNGNGLGLFIAKRTAEMHGGKLWFESTEHIGSTFHIAFPTHTSSKGL